MALLHSSTAPAALSCLELFRLAETQTGVTKIYTTDLPPTYSQSGSVYQFMMTGDSPDYLVLNMMKLVGKYRIVHADGSPLVQNELAVPINLLMQTAWKQIDLTLGNMIISHPQQMFPWKAIINFLLMTSEETKNTQGASQGYYKDSAGEMDTVAADESAILSKLNLCQLSKWVDFEGAPLEDCASMPRFILNNVKFGLKLTRASDEFCILAADQTKAYKLEFCDLKLRMCWASVSSGVLLGHHEALKHANALYPFTRVEMMNHSVPAGDSNVTLYNICTKSVPSRLVVGMVTAEAYNGSFQKNPFNFQHFHVSNISLVVNESIVGGQPLVTNFDPVNANGRDYVTAYNNMFSSTGTDGTNFGNNIKIEEFPEGYALFCFNLEPFAQGKFLNLIRTGFVRLSLQFAKPLTETIVIIIY